MHMEKNSKIIDTLIEIFISGFRDIYEIIDEKDKTCLFDYINNFFRKWYYSSFIDNSELSPAFLAAASNNDKYPLYPVIGAADSGIAIHTYEYSLDKHPFLADFRLIAKKVAGIVKLDEDFNISDEFFDEIKNHISIADRRYAEYIILTGIEAEIFEKMPSVGVTAIKLSDEAEEIFKRKDRDILLLLIESAMDMAASNLSEKFLGEYYEIEWEDIALWLSKPMPIDVIFNECYDEMGVGAEAMASFLSGDADDIDRAISVNSFRRGLNFDKWFLTPFGYYFRLIEPCYLCEFSFYDELEFFMDAYIDSNGFKVREVMDAALYSPCTSYRITRLGAEMFETEYKKCSSDIFDKITPEDIINVIAEGSIKDVENLISMTSPKYDIITLRISNFSKEKLWLDIDIAADSSLDYLHLYISYIFRREVLFCHSFRFYKLPASPFTEYTPSYLGERGPKTDNTTIKEILDENEECFYEAVFYGKNEDFTARAKITHKKISLCKKGYDYPRISKLCKKLKEEQNK